MTIIDKAKVANWVIGLGNDKVVKPEPDFDIEVTGVLTRLRVTLEAATLKSAAQWLLFTDRFLAPPIRQVHLQRGQVIEVDLGPTFEGEESYKHPCIVARAGANWAVVIPMTSQRFGSGYQVDLVNNKVASRPGDPNHGKNQIDFWLPGVPKPSSALVDQIRMVSKHRVIELWRDAKGDIVIVPDIVLDALDEIVVRIAAPSVGKALREKTGEVQSLQARVKQLEAELAASRVVIAPQ